MHAQNFQKRGVLQHKSVLAQFSMALKMADIMAFFVLWLLIRCAPCD